jgi:hypothetical protein
MDGHRRVRGFTALAALSAALAVSAVAPALASGQNVVDEVLNGLGVGGEATPAAGVPDGSGDGYQPPLHGDNPHGQGTVGVIDIQPSNTLPLSGDPVGGDDPDQEEIVVGRSRGEQNADGSYHGHITVLALFGNEVLGVDTVPGETENGPLQPLQVQLLDPLCENTQENLCLQVLKADSSTTDSGSTNSFSVLNARIGGEEGVTTGVAESNGNISSDGSCQTSHGDSNVASLGAGGNEVAVVGESSSDSTACNNGTSSVSQDSRWIQLGGEDVPIPCGSGEETEFDPLFPIVAAVCNANDENGIGEQVTQAGMPYGVREAFSLFLLAMEDSSLARQFEGPTAALKGTVAASESHAVAPPSQAGPTPTTPTTPGGAGGQAGQKGGGGAGGEGEGEGGGAGAGEGGPAAEAAAPGAGDLAFTGTDVLVLALIGMGLVMAGLTATRLAGRHRRATV